MLGIHLIVPFEKASLHIYSLVNGWMYWRTARGSSAQSVRIANINDSLNDAATQDRAEKADDEASTGKGIAARRSLEEARGKAAS